MLWSSGVDNRAQRVESIVTYLVNRPGEAEKLTGATVEKMYAEHGVEVSSRQIRRDIEDARGIAADRLRSPALPHWSEDVDRHRSSGPPSQTVLRSDQSPDDPPTPASGRRRTRPGHR